MENLRMEHNNGWLLSDPLLHLTSSPVCDHLPPLSSPSPPPEQGGSFSSPLPRCSPLSCKLEPPVSPSLEFVSLCLSRDEPASNIQGAMAAVKDRMHTLSVNESSNGVLSCEVKEDQAEEPTVASSEDVREVKDRMHTLSLSEGISCQERPGEVTIASLKDGSTGPKPGKRFFRHDVAGDEAAKQAENSSGSSKSGSSSSNNNNGLQRKKQKVSSSSYVTPRCQVEGCHVDLSASKDYHRRHKVCELHSKASVSKVAGREQRFCQQCSRFHVLSEFDEGRRSCRRRLAGHNERRRKPPQEPIPFLSAGTLAYLAGSRFNTLFMENPYLLQRGETIGSSSVTNTPLAPKFCLTGFLPEEDVGSNYQVSESDHIMQGLPMGGGLLDARRALIAASGNRLLLSSASGPPLAISPASSSMSLALNSQRSSEMAFSGCALSLLSSSLGTSNNPCTMSMSVGTTPSPADQLLMDAHMLPLPHERAFSSSCLSTSMGVFSALNGHSANLNEGLTNASIEHLAGMGIPQSSLMLEGMSMLPEYDFHTMQSGGNYVPPMLDLMQVSSLDSQQQVAQMGLLGLPIFDRQTTM